MKIAHLADLHLGFRQYQRQTPAGINQREADVSSAFHHAIDRIIELSPDVVLIAGDVFHNVRPTNPAILDAFIQFSRLAQMLPDTIVVMVAGNHDTPRTTETGCILRLFRQLGVHVVEGKEQRLYFEDRGLSVLAVPDLPSGLPALTPDPSARYNVLLVHGEVAGILPDYLKRLDRAGLEIAPQDLHADQWDYVALGHYHVYRRIAPNAFYSGSIEYTSTNPWGELGEERTARIAGKGFIEHDLVTGEHTFHPLRRVRDIVDLPPLAGTGMNAEQLGQAIVERVDSVTGGIENKIIRLVVRDVPRHIARQLDPKPLRDFRRRALHFQLDTRRPDIVRLPSAGGAPVRRVSLADTVRSKLENRPLESGLDREQLIALGLQYLQQTAVRHSEQPLTPSAMAAEEGAGE